MCVTFPERHNGFFCLIKVIQLKPQANYQECCWSVMASPAGSLLFCGCNMECLYKMSLRFWRGLVLFGCVLPYLNSCRHVMVKKAFPRGPYGESTRSENVGFGSLAGEYWCSWCQLTSISRLKQESELKKVCSIWNIFDKLHWSRFLYLVVLSHMVMRGVSDLLAYLCFA